MFKEYEKTLKYAECFFKVAANDVFVYTFVPPEAIQHIKNKGLLSGKLLLQNQKLLNIAKPKKTDRRNNMEIKKMFKN